MLKRLSGLSEVFDLQLVASSLIALLALLIGAKAMATAQPSTRFQPSLSKNLESPEASRNPKK